MDAATLAERLRHGDPKALDELYELASYRTPMPVLFGGVGGRITNPDWAYCPRCKMTIDNYNDPCYFCPECGQALDWSEAPEDGE